MPVLECGKGCFEKQLPSPEKAVNHTEIFGFGAVLHGVWPEAGFRELWRYYELPETRKTRPNADDGVLFFDADGSGDISERKEYVFTDWDPTATSDLEALRAVFDTNGDGRLTSDDSTWSRFKVARTDPDGRLSYHTLTALGITEIDLMGDATQIELPDGSGLLWRSVVCRAHEKMRIV